MDQPWRVYIAQTKTGRYYVGMTTDSKRRIEDHNQGKGAKLVLDQGEFTLRYVSDPFASKSDARKREVQIKGWRREKKEKLIRGEWE